MTGQHYLTGHARLAGVMGWPIGHTRSPRLHGYWLRHYGVDGTYLPLGVPGDRLEPALRGLAALGFRGVNVTIPHKERTLALVDSLSERARRIGAVNTVVVADGGGLLGDNTDGFGFLANLQAGAPGWRADRGPAVLLGAGGAARAIAVALLDAGVPELRLTNRTAGRAEALAAALKGSVTVVPWDERSAALDRAALLVNSTSLGMAGQPPLDIDLGPLPQSALVTDIVYVPLETDLLAAARRRGNPAIDGLGMLLHQARPGFHAWFGIDPEVTDGLRAAVQGD